jgi:hypothetical protein
VLEETIVAMHITKVVIIIIHGGTFTVSVSADLISHAGTSHAEYIAARGKGGRDQVELEHHKKRQQA